MVFKKTKKVPFSTEEVYGPKFKPSNLTCINVVFKLLTESTITISGGIDESMHDQIAKRDLWSYIYYLYIHNKETIAEFEKMRDSRGRASGDLFFNSVQSVVTGDISYNIRNSSKNIVNIDESSLIYFVNFVVTKYSKIIKNPLIEQVQKLVKSNKGRITDIRLSGATINPKILRGTNANDANIKFSLQTI